MGFNLITFLAQIVNLLLLVWLLKHFLYRPILNIIDKRREQIATTIKEADQKLVAAAQLENNLAQKQAKFEQEHQKRLTELEQEILQQKSKMMKELELNYQVKREKMQDDLDRSWQLAENQICQMIGTEFMILAQGVLSEWSQQTPMDQVLILFDKKIARLPKKQKKACQQILSQQKSIQILTSTTLNKKQQDMLHQILASHFNIPAKMRLQFKKSSQLLLGLEIRLGDFLLDWNLKSYLAEVNQRLKQNISHLITSGQRKVS